MNITVGILLIATRKYIQYVQNLVDDIKKHFLPDRKIIIYLFTDDADRSYFGNERVTILKYLIPSYGFPDATMLRYHIFTQRKYHECDYLFYMDVDMSIQDEIGDDILGDIVAVIHPGFYKGGGSWETREGSASFVPEEKRKKYYAGGFQGGEADLYYSAMIVMKYMIELDRQKDIVPVWHDESAWNKILSEQESFTELLPSYVMVEEEHLRKAWGIDGLPVKIVALAKDHAQMRS